MSSSEPGGTRDSGDLGAGSIPVANLRLLRRRSWAWVLPILALLLAVFLGGRAWSARGPELLLIARHGHGIGPGDLLLYRGIAVGDVQGVELAQDLASVEVRVRLDPAAERIARAGSRFWVVRPDITLDRLRGVETLLGSRHLAVLPGSPDAPVQREFVCLEETPVLTSDDGDGLEFVLEAPLRFGLSPGAPLTYRQIEVGTVVAVGLSSDARSVEVRCLVRGPYGELVREDSRFWESGGIEFSLELLDGLSIDIESLRSLLVGGISFASPTRPGAAVRTGHRFPLAAEPEQEWLDWSPALPVGGLSPGTSAPGLLRARLVGEEGFFDRSQAQSGWVLPSSAGLIGPADLLVPPDDADEPALELRGERLPLLGPPEALALGLARRDLVWPEVPRWPLDRVRDLIDAEDCLVVGDPASAPTALAAARLAPEAGLWRVDPAISFDESWHGAAVLARSDGRLVGLLLVVEGRGSVAPLGAFLD